MTAPTNLQSTEATPTDGFGTTSRRQARIEDVDWMAATGETLPGAAARLHIHPGSLRSSLVRAGRDDLVRKLLANQDHRPSFAVGAVVGTVIGSLRSGGGEAA